MKTIKTTITLPEGTFDTELDTFDKSDKSFLRDVYSKWVELSDILQSIRGRRINLPESLSESVFCMEFNAGRLNESISGANTSFDCYQIQEQRRIQVKACSVSEDLTSFGPNSVWDDLYFIHFFPNKKYDGCYSIYLIDSDLIYNHKVNARQTMKDQQRENRRPRFSLMREIIIPKKLKPTVTGNLFT